MPGEDIYSWSTTAANNDTADTAINWRENQARASVNDSARSQMAAHAKNRNLQNGSITTGGTANALTFTSGVGYTAVPSGMRVLLKIGPGLTNTGAATLAMDLIAAVAIVDMAGMPLLGGEMVAGSYVEFLYDGTSWILLRRGATTGGGVSGRLAVNSATVLAFIPYNGNAIKIAGILYEIPTAGITATVTNCYVNGVAAQTLAVGSTYNCYVFNNAGTLTLDFSATAHATDTTPGNVGIEIKNADPTRSLVGKVLVSGGPSFADTDTFRGVLSWFNRRQRVGKTSYNGTTASGILVDAGSASFFLSWGDEDAYFSLAGNTSNTIVGVTNYTNLYLDGTTYILPDTTWETIAVVPGFQNIAGTYYLRLAEGKHYFNHRVATNGGASCAGAWIVNANVVFTG